MQRRPKVSVIIKALNEEHNIERSIRSALEAAKHVSSSEVILADSLSVDRTIEIAAKYPIRIVQLLSADDRSCGVGAQLGYQLARGDYVYILDADMELNGDFLAAAVAELDANTEFSGIGGLVQEMNIVNAEFRGRIAQAPHHMRSGEVDYLTGGGLYRHNAIAHLGYLTNRNLHAFEELELGIRLRAQGGLLKRLDIIAVRHYGHTDASFALLLHRWNSRYAWGGGELLRSAWGTQYFGVVLRSIRMFRQSALVATWWLAILAVLSMCPPAERWIILPLIATTVAVTSFRRKSLFDGVYSIAFLSVFAVGTIAGLLAHPKARPNALIAMNVLQP